MFEELLHFQNSFELSLFLEESSTSSNAFLKLKFKFISLLAKFSNTEQLMCNIKVKYVIQNEEEKRIETEQILILNYWKNQHKTCKISTQKKYNQPFTISGKSYLLHYLSVVLLHFIFIWIPLCTFYSSWKWKQLLQNRSFGSFFVL